MWLLRFPDNLYYFSKWWEKLKNIFLEIFCLRIVLSHFPFTYIAASVIILECRTDGTFAIIRGLEL